MVILDTTIVNVAVPAIEAGLRGSIAALQWVINGYTLTFAALLLTAGTTCDRIGAKRVFVAGLVVFVVGSGLCAAAMSIGWLIGARLLQGVGAALLLPASLALISHAFPEPGARARAVGVWATAAGAATAIGPLLGGLLVDGLGWRAIFLVNLPIGAVAIVLALRFMSETARGDRGFNLVGQLLGVAALGLVTVALTDAGAQGWTSAWVLGAGSLGLAASAAFVVAQRRAREPMMPPQLFVNRTFSASNVCGLLLNFGIYGQVFVLSLYFQHARHFSALLTGVALLPFAGVTVVAPIPVGRLTARFGPRPLMAGGQAFAAVGSVILAGAGTRTSYAVVAVGLLLLGTGFAMTIPSLTAGVIVGAPRQLAGIASGVLNAARQVGGTVGVALLGSLVSGAAGLIAGMHVALALVAATFLLGSVVALAFVQRGAVGEAPNVPARDGGGRGDSTPHHRRALSGAQR